MNATFVSRLFGSPRLRVFVLSAFLHFSVFQNGYAMVQAMGPIQVTQSVGLIGHSLTPEVLGQAPRAWLAQAQSFIINRTLEVLHAFSSPFVFASSARAAKSALGWILRGQSHRLEFKKEDWMKDGSFGPAQIFPLLFDLAPLNPSAMLLRQYEWRVLDFYQDKLFQSLLYLSAGQDPAALIEFLLNDEETRSNVLDRVSSFRGDL